MPTAEKFAHSPRTLLHIAAALRQSGISPVEIFQRAGVPPSALLNADGWVPRELCFTLGEQAETISGDPFFGARIGESFNLAELGTWGSLVAGAANVGEAFAVAAKNIELVHKGSGLDAVAFHNHTELRFAYHGRLGANPRQHLLGTLVVLRKIALLANAPEAVSVHFSLPYTRGADCLEETHGSRLEFGCEHDAIVVDRDIVNLPLHITERSGALDSVETAEAIGALVLQLLPYGRANIQTIATLQGVSIRTLQRRLMDWGFTFEELLDDIRRKEALRYVDSREQSATEIAFLLGYSDLAHFTRAFRRWTGMSPRSYVRVLKS